MKRYIKPEIEIVNFDIESKVMSNTDQAIMALDATATIAPILSTPSTTYQPTDVDAQVWSNVDDTNWNWEQQ